MSGAKKLSNKQVAAKVSCVGLGYAIQHYLSGNEFSDKKLREAWKTAKEALNKIDTILQKYYE